MENKKGFIYSLKKVFILDDRTGLFSTSKIIRWLTWLLGAMTVINLQLVIYLNWVDISQEDVNMLQIVERLIMALIGITETAYQFNRNNKLKTKSVYDEVIRENIKEEKIERVDI